MGGEVLAAEGGCTHGSRTLQKHGAGRHACGKAGERSRRGHGIACGVHRVHSCNNRKAF